MVRQEENPTTKLVRRTLALGCFAAVALIPPPAFADEHPASVQIDQVQKLYYSSLKELKPDEAKDQLVSNVAVLEEFAECISELTEI